jgi:PAS domain S-box-containing protein
MKDAELDFHALFDAIPASILVVLPDSPDFTIVAASNGYLEATKSSRADIVGRGIFQVLPRGPNELQAGAAVALKHSFENVLRNGKADIMAIQRYYVRRPEAGGEEWEDRYWRVINSPVLGRHGDFAYLIHRAQDVTEYVRLKEGQEQQEHLMQDLRARTSKAENEILMRGQEIQRLNRQLQRALVRQERLRAEAQIKQNWLEHVLLEVNEQVFALDRDWRYVYVNDRVAQVFGLSKDQMLGRTIWELFPGSVGTVFEQQIRRASAEFTPVHFEYCYPPWKRWFELHVYPSVERLTFFVTEITDRKNAEATLQQSKERLAAELATMNRLHELTIRLFGAMDLAAAMSEVLEPVLALLGTDMGDIQLYDDCSDSAKIVAQRGFTSEFMDYRQGSAAITEPACARAVETGRRVIVEDVESDVLYEPYRDAAAAAGYRAIQATPLLSRGGDLLGVLCTYSRQASCVSAGDLRILDLYARYAADLIERLRIEKNLRESEERLRLATEFGKVGVWDWDIRGNHMSWTDSLYAICGVRPEGFVATVEHFMRLIHPEDRQHVVNQIEHALQDDLPSELEFRAVRPNGDVIWLLTNARVLRESGRAVRMLGATVDITERKRVEEALQESEQRFRDMADHASVMVWVTEADGRCSFMSKSWYDFTGQTPETGLGMGWSSAAHPDDRSYAYETFVAANRKQEPFRAEYRLRRNDGEYRWVLDAAIPRFSKDGTFLGHIGSVIDITERKGIEDALKEADRRKDEFLANMSHEIRSPMTGILGYADILLANLQDPDHIECVKTIKQSGNYLLEIINDLLDLSKIESGKLTLQKDSISIPVLLNEIHSLISVRAKEKDLRLILRYDGPIPENVISDRIRLRQILINLIANGIKFTEKGVVQVISRFVPESSTLEFEVADTGMGIPKQMHARLFQPFTQADTSATREYGGTGLGLAITKRLVEVMGGSISFETEMGKGTTFRVSIPIEILTNTELHGTWLGGRMSSPSQLSRIDCRVLVVDDRPEMRSLFRYFIEAAGGRVWTAEDGRAAIEAVQTADAEGQPIDVVLMDIQMPGLDGYEATRRLRDAGYRNAIVALTASAMKSDREKCLAVGCNDYLTKPVEPNQLIDLISRYTPETPLRAVPFHPAHSEPQ